MARAKKLEPIKSNRVPVLRSQLRKERPACDDWRLALHCAEPPSHEGTGDTALLFGELSATSPTKEFFDIKQMVNKPAMLQRLQLLTNTPEDAKIRSWGPTHGACYPVHDTYRGCQDVKGGSRSKSRPHHGPNAGHHRFSRSGLGAGSDFHNFRQPKGASDHNTRRATRHAPTGTQKNATAAKAAPRTEKHASTPTPCTARARPPANGCIKSERPLLTT